LKHYSWCLSGNYITGQVNGKSISLSRFIMKYEGNNYVDHIDGNTLNNQKNNLRILSPEGNSQNKCSQKNSTSQYIGVSYVKTNKKWLAQLKGRIGYFPTELEAAQARDKRAHELNTTQNTFYKLNFPI